MKLRITEEIYSQILEAAKRFDELPIDTGLFIKPLNNGYELILYSPQEKQIYGTIGIRNFNTSDYTVSYVAAQQGYGVYMYELAMMQLDEHDAGLMPDRTGNIRPKAWNIWKKFYERDDVEKYQARGSNYSDKINVFLGDTKSDIDNKIYNTVFYMQPNNDYFTLINNAQKHLSKKSPDKIYTVADKFFKKMY